jgi:hypothetical protein
MFVLYRTHRDLDNIVHIVRERTSQYNIWDPLCMIGWNSAFVPTPETGDDNEVPTCLTCVGTRVFRS